VNDLQIEAFLEVLRHNSFSKASQEIFVPQPTLTHRIKQLEDELGEMLIYRSSKGIMLTSAGKLFLPYARQIYDAVNKGKKQIEFASKGISGMLSFGVSFALAQYVLPHLLGQFLKLHPHFHININAQPSEVVIHNIRERKVSFGLTRHRSSDANLQYELIHQDAVQVLVSPNHRFSRREYIDIHEACEEQVITYPQGTFFRELIENSLHPYNARVLHPIEINHSELIKSLVKEGHGITFLPNLYTQKDIELGELIAVPLVHNPFPYRDTYIAYNEDYTDGSFQIFLEFTREFFKSYP